MVVGREQRDAEPVLREVAEAVRRDLELGGIGLRVGVGRALGDAELHLVGGARAAHGERERHLQQRVALAPFDPRAELEPARARVEAHDLPQRAALADPVLEGELHPLGGRRVHVAAVRAGERAARVVGGTGSTLPRVVGDRAVARRARARWRGALSASRPSWSEAEQAALLVEARAQAAVGRGRARRGSRRRRSPRRLAPKPYAGARTARSAPSRSAISARANGVRFKGAGSPPPSAAIAASRSSAARAPTRAWSRSAASWTSRIELPGRMSWNWRVSSVSHSARSSSAGYSARPSRCAIAAAASASRSSRSPARLPRLVRAWLV